MSINQETARGVVDGLSISALVATFMGYLPQAAALLTFIWTAVRLYETATAQRIIACLIARLKRKHGADDHVHQDKDP